MANGKLWIEVDVDLGAHPKLISSAKSLGIPGVHLEGHLVRLWRGTLKYAEDGDLWRGDEERTLRFFESLADIPDNPTRYVDVLRLDHWLDGWLIHDWLDTVGKYLIAKYKSHNRDKLVEIWQKHGRTYGRDSEGVTSLGKYLGSDREVFGTGSDPPLTQTLTFTKTLTPTTQNETLKDNPKGGVGGKQQDSAGKGFLFSEGEGLRVQGFVERQEELTGGGFSHKEVYEVFIPLLVMHGIFSLEGFYARVKRSGVTPAEWVMLYLDKLQAVYRDRNGTTLLDDDADPVGMTMSGLSPGKHRRPHRPTEAARQLFLEIMMDSRNEAQGGKSKWRSRLSGPGITLELNRRKGRSGQVAS